MLESAVNDAKYWLDQYTEMGFRMQSIRDKLGDMIKAIEHGFFLEEIVELEDLKELRGLTVRCSETTTMGESR